MAFPPLSRVDGLNISGACYMDVVAASDIATMPDQIRDNVAGTIGLKAGKVWSRIDLAPPGSRLVDKWVLVQGEQVSDLRIVGFVGKDQLALLPNLWNIKNERYVVVFFGMNGDMLVAGRPEEGCRALVTERERGDQVNVSNGYHVEFFLRRLECVPFYNGTPPTDVLVGPCPTVEQLIPEASWGTIQGSLTPDQLDDAQASICPSFCALVDIAVNPTGGNTSFIVAGAGTPGHNGTYNQVATLNGKPAHTDGAGGASFWDGTKWILRWGPLDYISTEDVPTAPEVVTWVADTAAAPVPTVTAVAGDGDASQLMACLDSAQRTLLLEVLLESSTGAEIWAALTPTQQAQVLVAAGVVTIARINTTGPPYDEITIAP